MTQIQIVILNWAYIDRIRGPRFWCTVKYVIFSEFGIVHTYLEAITRSNRTDISSHLHIESFYYNASRTFLSIPSKEASIGRRSTIFHSTPISVSLAQYFTCDSTCAYAFFGNITAHLSCAYTYHYL